MKRRRVTKRNVDALRCPHGRDRVFLWDEALSGFGVAAFPSGTKVYVAQFRVNGRSRRMKLGEHGRVTPDEARRMAKKVLGAVEDGKDPIEQRRSGRLARSFREVADEYLRLHVKPKRKARTYSDYERLLNLHILPVLGSRSIRDLKKVDVARLHAGMADTPGAANRTIALISAVWNWAARRDEVPAVNNAATGIERYPERSFERYLSTAELSLLGDTLRKAETEGLPWDIDANKPTAKHIPKSGRMTVADPYAVAAIRLLIFTGARLREILDAKWDYVDWERGIMFLPDSKAGRKPLYLSAAVLSLLKELSRVKGNPHIIPGAKKGAPRADLKKPWNAIRRSAGLSDVRIHDLRHTYASIGAGASLGLPVIGKLLGHSQPATTARYAHLDADPMHRAADIISGQIAAALEGKQGNVVELRGKNRKRMSH